MLLEIYKQFRVSYDLRISFHSLFISFLSNIILYTHLKLYKIQNENSKHLYFLLLSFFDLSRTNTICFIKLGHTCGEKWGEKTWELLHSQNFNNNRMKFELLRLLPCFAKFIYFQTKNSLAFGTYQIIFCLILRKSKWFLNQSVHPLTHSSLFWLLL